MMNLFNRLQDCLFRDRISDRQTYEQRGNAYGDGLRTLMRRRRIFEAGAALSTLLLVSGDPLNMLLDGDHQIIYTDKGPVYRSADGWAYPQATGARDTALVYFVPNEIHQAWAQLGAERTLGYAVSRPFTAGDKTLQAFQRGIVEVDKAGRLQLLNTYQLFHEIGLDDSLYRAAQIPRHRDFPEDANLNPENPSEFLQIMQNHLNVFNQSNFEDERTALTAIKQLSIEQTPDWLRLYGLPISAETFVDPLGEKSVTAVRFQRTTFYYAWKNLGWANSGEVRYSQAGELAREANLFASQYPDLWRPHDYREKIQPVEITLGKLPPATPIPQPTPQYSPTPRSPRTGVLIDTDRKCGGNIKIKWLKTEVLHGLYIFNLTDNTPVYQDRTVERGSRTLKEIILSGMNHYEETVPVRPGHTYRVIFDETDFGVIDEKQIRVEQGPTPTATATSAPPAPTSAPPAPTSAPPAPTSIVFVTPTPLVTPAPTPTLSNPSPPTPTPPPGIFPPR